MAANIRLQFIRVRALQHKIDEDVSSHDDQVAEHEANESPGKKTTLSREHFILEHSLNSAVEQACECN